MARTAYTTTARPGIMSRLRARATPRTATRTSPRSHTTRSTRRGPGGGATTTTVTKTTQTTHHPAGVAATHHRRRPGIGDKISGALLKLKGSLTRRPGQKAAGTRRMRGTDGRRAHRQRRFFASSSSSLSSEVSTVPSKKLSIASADEALNTAINLVAQVKQLQSRIVEVESILEFKEDEISILTRDRDNWKQRAETVLEVQRPILERQPTKKEELQPQTISPDPPQHELVSENPPISEQSQEQDHEKEATVAIVQDIQTETSESSEKSSIPSGDETKAEISIQNPTDTDPGAKDPALEEPKDEQSTAEPSTVQYPTAELDSSDIAADPPPPQTIDEKLSLETEREIHDLPSNQPPKP